MPKENFLKRILGDIDGNLYDLEYALKRIYGGLLHTLGVPGASLWQPLRDYKLEPNDELVSPDVLTPAIMGDVFSAAINRKPRGTFYTPKEIVDYMVTESLKNHLFTHFPQIPQDKIEALFKNAPHSFTPSEAQQVAENLLEISILEPCCGAGAFVIGCLNWLYKTIKKLSPEWNNFDLKSRIASKCIYAIDIEPRAVAITKFRVYICILIEDPKRYDELPELKNIVVGDFLLGKVWR